MNIIKGKQQSPVKGIVYGQAGIGKTTFASKWPSPIFIDIENGSGQIDVSRVIPKTYAEVKQILAELLKDPQGFKTIVIDSTDKLEQMIIQDICNANGIKSIEQYEKGYGKGWTHLVECWANLLDYLDRIRTTHGVNVLLVGHSVIKRYEPADDSGYDRYTLTIYAKSAELLKGWSDITLFVRYDVVSQLENGKNKACGNAPRVMHSQFHPCWDAKNRYGLPDKMKFDFANISSIFSGPATESPVQNAKSPAPAPAIPVPENPHGPAPVAVKAQDPEKENALSQLMSLVKQSGVTVDDVRGQIERRGVVPSGTPLENYNLATLKRIITGWSAICHNISITK